jgi:gamma-glutamyltranspeptidase/glutathione hydrolase
VQQQFTFRMPAVLKSRTWLYFSGIFFMLSGISCRKTNAFTYDYQRSAVSKEGVVVSAHPFATLAGVHMLEIGGNAIDAAVAVHLALAVVYPRAGNIGGGGFMVYRDSVGNSITLDFREKAPKAAHRDMYLDDEGNVVPGLSS